MISVVIPTLGRSRHLSSLLEGLRRTKAECDANGLSVEVLVVANTPCADLQRRIAQIDDPSFRYLETGVLGVNRARNLGLTSAKGDVVLFLDDDVDIGNGAVLQGHWKSHIDFPEALAIGGPYILAEPFTLWDQAYHQQASRWLAANFLDENGTCQLLGGNLSFKRKRLNLLFDESIEFGGSEAFLLHQLSIAGEKMLFLRNLAVQHRPELTKQAMIRKAFLQGRGAAYRERSLPPLPHQHVHRWLARGLLGSNAQSPPNSENLDTPPRLARAMSLYHRSFQKGLGQGPHRSVKKTLSALIRQFYVFTGGLIDIGPRSLSTHPRRNH